MAQPNKKTNPWRKRILTGGSLLVVTLGIIYWAVATDRFADTKNRKAAYAVNAFDFIREFQQNVIAANKKYADKIVTVTGRVSEVETADTTVNIKFTDSASGSYAIFAFQEQHLAEAKKLNPGDSISVKGSFSSGIFSEILGTISITFKRCALNK